MADLESKLVKIESALGGDTPTPSVDDKLGWHLDYIEDLIQEGGGGGDVQLKTINGQSLKGEGNIAITTYQAFDSSWPVDSSHTAKQFCDILDADANVVIGMGYFGGAKWSDKPAGLSNGDVVVEILEGPNSTKAIHLIMTSSSVYPYRWEYTYWSHGSTSGWRGVQPEVGINPTLSGNEDSITSLQFGNTKYKVGGGNSLHLFRVAFSNILYGYFFYFTETESFVDIAALKTELSNHPTSGFFTNSIVNSSGKFRCPYAFNALSWSQSGNSVIVSLTEVTLTADTSTGAITTSSSDKPAFQSEISSFSKIF